MKKLVLLLSFSLMITSCHHEVAEDVSLENHSSLTSSKKLYRKQLQIIPL